MPRGTAAAPFTDNFYGNGHTIFIKGFDPDYTGSDFGFFGVVGGNAVIRDVTIIYAVDGNLNNTTPSNAVTVDPTGAARFGGIAGRAIGNARFENVLVKGAAAFNVSGDTTAYVGGIVGLLGRLGTTGNEAEVSTASIYNAYGGLNLTVNKTNTGTTGSLYVGGIAGSMGHVASGDPVTVEEVSAVGNITVGGNGAVNATDPVPVNSVSGLFVGGIAGFIRGSGTGAVLEASDYRQGIITVNSGAGSVWVGGAVGSIFADGTVTNCSSLQSGFNIYKSGSGNTFLVGSFVGLFYGGKVEYCYTEGPVIINTTFVTSGTINAGGFAGRIAVTTSYCYAKGDVSVLGFGYIMAGGFSGAITSGITLSNCYATGNVSAINRGTGTDSFYPAIGSTHATAAGGFVGFCSNTSLVIENCYALGDVFADKPAGDGGLFVGGLIGVTNGRTENCFAAGSIIAQRASSNADITGSDNVQRAIYAGGLIGRKTGTANAQNNAARGERITATSPGVINIGRVFGARTGSGTISNRAFNDMQFRTSSTYGAGGIAPTYPASTDAASNDGADAHLGNFRDRTFWSGLGFTTANWDFSTVESRGYPVLRGLAGQ